VPFGYEDKALNLAPLTWPGTPHSDCFVWCAFDLKPAPRREVPESGAFGARYPFRS